MNYQTFHILDHGPTVLEVSRRDDGGALWFTTGIGTRLLVGHAAAEEAVGEQRVGGEEQQRARRAAAPARQRAPRHAGQHQRVQRHQVPQHACRQRTVVRLRFTQASEAVYVHAEAWLYHFIFFYCVRK